MSSVVTLSRPHDAVVPGPGALPMERPRAPSKAGTPIDPNMPYVGWFKTRYGKDKPFVPARTYRLCHCTPVGGDDGDPHVWTDRCDRFPPVVVEVEGRIVDTLEWWPRVAGRPINEADFQYMTAYAAWCREHAPHLPEANPHRRITLADSPAPF